MRMTVLGFLGVGILFAGCGGSSDDGMGSGGKGIPIEDVPKLFGDAQCAAIKECFGPAYEAFLGGETCEANAEAAIEDEIPSIKQAIDDGLIRYDGTKLQACVDKLSVMGCAVITGEQPPECTDAFDGTVERGEDCAMDSVCKGTDTYCRSSGSCPGKCSPVETAGGECSRDSDCATGLKCSETTDRCVEPASNGGSCGGGSAPDCDAGLLCIGEDEDAGTPGTCKPIDEVLSATDGADCNLIEGPFCAAGLSCVIDGFDMSTGTLITSCVSGYSSGAACKFGFPDPCPDDEYCDADPMTLDGTCTKRPAAGEACAGGPFSNGDADVCTPNTQCDDGTCRARQELGGSCKGDDVCYSGSCVGGSCASAGACE